MLTEKAAEVLGRQDDPKARVAQLNLHARRALGSEAEARAFMEAPHPELDGRTPAEAAVTERGMLRAEQILHAIEYGLAL